MFAAVIPLGMRVVPIDCYLVSRLIVHQQSSWLVFDLESSREGWNFRRSRCGNVHSLQERISEVALVLYQNHALDRPTTDI